MNARQASGGGRERYFLGLALLVPLVLAALIVIQLPATLASASTTSHGDAASRIVNQRPASSNPAPPPTLVPPSATATPELAAATAAVASPTPDGSYVVQSGDELKHIATDHGVSMAILIEANTIPNPDSLRVGQVLRIPRT